MTSLPLLSWDSTYFFLLYTLGLVFKWTNINGALQSQHFILWLSTSARPEAELGSWLTLLLIA